MHRKYTFNKTKKICANPDCKNEFEATISSQKYCSITCRNEYAKSRRKEYNKQYSHEYYKKAKKENS